MIVPMALCGGHFSGRTPSRQQTCPKRSLNCIVAFYRAQEKNTALAEAAGKHTMFSVAEFETLTELSVVNDRLLETASIGPCKDDGIHRHEHSRSTSATTSPDKHSSSARSSRIRRRTGSPGHHMHALKFTPLAIFCLYKRPLFAGRLRSQTALRHHPRSKHGANPHCRRV